LIRAGKITRSEPARPKIKREICLTQNRSICHRSERKKQAEQLRTKVGIKRVIVV